MEFFIKRYLESFRHHWHWIFIALLPPVLYLAAQAYFDRTFVVSQELSYTGAVQFAKNPVETLSLDQLVENPDLLFQEDFPLSQLSRDVTLFQLLGADRLSEVEIRSLIKSTMSLSEPADATILLSYKGQREGLGRFLVEYFTKRLEARASSARERSKSASTTGAHLAPSGSVAVTTEKSLWDSRRQSPAAAIFLVSVVVVLIGIGLAEMFDASFKSDRQIAQYLGLPILGSLPNAASLAKRIEQGSKDQGSEAS